MQASGDRPGYRCGQSPESFVIDSHRTSELEKEKEERQEMELAVAAFNRSLTSIQDKCNSIESEIEQYRAITENLRRGEPSLCDPVEGCMMELAWLEKNKERSVLRKNASRVVPDLNLCQESLGFLMEGIENDQLLLRFWRLEMSDPEAEASLVLDVSNPHYRGMLTIPPPKPLSIVKLTIYSSHLLAQPAFPPNTRHVPE